MRAWWFDPVYGKWFLQLWQRYMREVAMIDRNHPFAFVNLDREPIGDMYCIDSFTKAHEAAVHLTTRLRQEPRHNTAWASP